jgi:hypothetical protein
MGDIQTYGWHMVSVPADDLVPGWTFTVGLWHTFGSPELAVFAMEIGDAQGVLTSLVNGIRAEGPVDLAAVRDDLLLGGKKVAFRTVNESWYRALFGYAMWFSRPPLPFAQVVWSDGFGRFPWDPHADAEYLTRQPRLWNPTSARPLGRWSAVLAPLPWPFSDPPTKIVITTKRFADGGAPLLGVTHDSDGGWQFLDGGPTTKADAALLHFAHIVGADHSLVELADLPLGWQAWRSDPGSRWIRALNHED